MASNAKKLRSGYTTGACAAAAAKAATLLLLRHSEEREPDTASRLLTSGLVIPFPDGSRHTFRIHHAAYSIRNNTACASVIKDAGDDPDITNGAEIVAEARMDCSASRLPSSVIIKGGKGVGVVTKPGLAVPVGQPAINPVPVKMIRDAVTEAAEESGLSRVVHGGINGEGTLRGIEITISVPNGEELAKKTLNARLGIDGGISILGTSGIVRPLSADAWTSSIAAAMDVAKAVGCEEVVLSAGRVSEKAHMKKYGLPVEAYVMMGDYVEFSLRAAKGRQFGRIHISAHWAKMLKISMAIPQTHVRHGAIDLQQGIAHLNRMGISVPAEQDFNTARQVYDYLIATYTEPFPLLRKVCLAAKTYAEGIAPGVPVVAHLVSYEGSIITDSD